MTKEELKRTLKIPALVLLLVISFSLEGIHSVNKLADDPNFTVLIKPAVVLQYSDTDMKKMSTELENTVKENAKEFLQSEDMQRYMEAKQAYEENPSTKTMTELYAIISQTYTSFFRYQVDSL